MHKNLNSDLSVEAWKSSFEVNWRTESANHGFFVRNEAGDVVGCIGAIYSKQIINGQPENFCNITSWCVLDEFRNQSMRLGMSVVSQKGFHFTDFTPTDVVVGALKFFNFKILPIGTTVIPNLPSVALARKSAKIITDQATMLEVLPDNCAEILRDHQGFSWLNFITIAAPNGKYCLVIYKKFNVRGVPSATLVHVSDSEVLANYYSPLSNYFLFKKRLFVSSVESRLIPHKPLLGSRRSYGQTKMYLSKTLDEKDISSLYSEAMCMDL